MKKQYIVQKYVMADSVAEAAKKSKRIPVHEIYLHNAWFEKVAGYEFSESKKALIGFETKQIKK